MKLDTLLAAQEALADLKKFDKFKFFRPYEKQQVFISLSAKLKESSILAGNQLGKSETGAFILACHLTGEYPDWWTGRRWDRPIMAWAAGPSSLQVRDTAQKKLCGEPGQENAWGTGMIPKRCLGRKTSSRGVADALDKIEVRHKSGGMSILVFKSYEQERIHWQGPPIDVIWCDEEPPMNLYTEALARLTATNGIIFCTFTPLKGMSEVVKRYLEEESKTRGFVQMGIRDAAHITPERVEEMLSVYPAHEREARLEGIPMLGEGRVWLTSEEEFITPLRLSEVPLHWVKIWGVDFGIDHPFAAVLIAWDRDNDTFYIVHCIRMTGAIPLQHADAMKRIAAGVSVAWPHDGHSRDKGSGEPLAQIYRKQGLLMLPEHATHPTGGMSLYAGITEMDTIMQGRRWKVLAGCQDWLQEYRQYHYKGGQIVAVHDDLISASRYAYMMRRKARAVPLGVGKPRAPGEKGIIAKGTTSYWHV